MQLTKGNDDELTHLNKRITDLNEEVKRKNNKIETLKDIVHSFQEEIKNFEHYQEAASRDIDKLKMKSEMYKKLYE